MNSPVVPNPRAFVAASGALRIAGIVLSRIAVGDATESLIARDLRPLLPAAPSERDWKAQVERLAVALISAGLATREGDRVGLTPDGMAAVQSFLGCKKPMPATWPALRDGPLLARALGLAGAPQARLKALAKPDGLRALIVATHWKLGLKGKPLASRIRQALALLALERAFGNQVKNEFGTKSGLSPKASRLLAGQLARKPRDFGTDGRLIAALAAEAVGARKPDTAQLRLGVLKRFLAEADTNPVTTIRGEAQAKAQAPVEQGTAASLARSPEPHPARQRADVEAPSVASQRPNPEGFAAAIKLAAAPHAEGWPGNRRAVVARVFDEIGARHQAWALSEVEFKAMLVAAHRQGLLSLATADLKDKNRLAELERSAITYKNTVWHYIRVED